MSKQGRNFAIGAMIAATAGYIAGVLTAPKSGKDTRRDIANSASKAKTEGEKQLKALHSELQETIDKANNQASKAKNKATKEYKEALAKADMAKTKTKLLLSALHDGDADDPNLKAVIKEATSAKNNLVKFIKK